jgi:hypothetical protein
MVAVLSSNRIYLAPCTNAKARLLLESNKATVALKEPFTVKLKKTIEKGEAVMNYIAVGDKSPRNLDNVCRIEKKGTLIMFFFDSITARGDWEFKDETEADSVYEEITEHVQELNWAVIEGQDLINLEKVCRFEKRENHPQIKIYFTDMTARGDWKFANEESADKALQTLLAKSKTTLLKG